MTEYCESFESTIQEAKKAMPRTLVNNIINQFGDEWDFMAAAYGVDTSDKKSLLAHKKWQDVQLASEFYTNNKHDILEWVFLEKSDENIEQSLRYTNSIDTLQYLTKEQVFEGMHKKDSEHYKIVSSTLTLTSVLWLIDNYVKVETDMENQAHLAFAHAFM